jgi:hypothetical protein
MAIDKRDEELVVSQDLKAALKADPQAAAIWDGLPQGAPAWARHRHRADHGS